MRKDEDRIRRSKVQTRSSAEIGNLLSGVSIARSSLARDTHLTGLGLSDHGATALVVQGGAPTEILEVTSTFQTQTNFKLF